MEKITENANNLAKELVSTADVASYIQVVNPTTGKVNNIKISDLASVVAGVLPVYETQYRLSNSTHFYSSGGVSNWVKCASIKGTSTAAIMICVSRVEGRTPSVFLISVGTDATILNCRYKSIFYNGVTCNVCYVKNGNNYDLYFKSNDSYPVGSISILMSRGNVNYFNELYVDKPDGAIDVQMDS